MSSPALRNTTGTTGTPASIAIRKAPFLKRPTVGVIERVPSGAKSTERVYVPGQPVPGQSQNDPTPLGPGQDVPLSPYSQVIQAYQQAALDATNRSLIPGSQRDLVRQYFSQLGEQSATGPK